MWLTKLGVLLGPSSSHHYPQNVDQKAATTTRKSDDCLHEINGKIVEYTKKVTML
jgi:hypothetical protein